MSLDRQRIYSRLSAPLQLQVVIDQRSLDDLKRRVSQYVNQSVKNFLQDISAEAVLMLRQSYSAVGRSRLARQWTNTPVTDHGGGTMSVRVYNRVESMPWYTQSNAPTKSGRSTKKYVMRGGGEQLLQILEGGARPHQIRARKSSNPLQFPLRWGEAESRSVGSAILKQGVSVGRFANRGRFNGVFAGGSVTHPGVVGSHFVDVVADRLAHTVGEAARDAFEKGKP